MSNQTRSPRMRTLKGGSIIFGLVPAIECVIRNLSDGGARLSVENATLIPDEFALVIKPERVRRKCRVAWRTADQIGVSFV